MKARHLLGGKVGERRVPWHSYSIFQCYTMTLKQVPRKPIKYNYQIQQYRYGAGCLELYMIALGMVRVSLLCGLYISASPHFRTILLYILDL